MLGNWWSGVSAPAAVFSLGSQSVGDPRPHPRPVVPGPSPARPVTCFYKEIHGMFLVHTNKLKTSWSGWSSLSELGLSHLCFEDFSLTVFLLLVISRNEPSKAV